MKTKKMKLALNKRTISNLEMKDVLGGVLDMEETFGGGSCPTVCFSYNPPVICKFPLSYWYTECLCTDTECPTLCFC